MSASKIALLGTGLMGGPMALNLAKAGHEMVVWNRTVAKAEATGLPWTNTPGEAVAGADVVISMLADGTATAKVLDDVIDEVPDGAIWIEMASVQPEQARAQAALLAVRGVGHLDAPVSGGTKGAEAATLAIMAGGPADVFAQAQPILAAMGRPVHVGPSGTGQLAKLANQAIVAITIGAVAEAMLLIEKGGGDPAAVRQALRGGFADSTILQQHGARMTTGDFKPGGLSRLQVKDLDNALGEANSLGLTLPSTEAVRARFDHFVTHMDGAEKDHSGLYLELLARNGLIHA